ncbi:MAG: XrtA/PEP-CTERM system-associated ATPase [Parvularculaceae bacterium]
MYEEYFGFSGPPFRLNPDPKFFFGSRSHNKAMAYLHYGLRQAEGFIVITGEIGAGKSMLIGHLIDQLDRSNVVAANLLTTNVEPDALLSHVLSAFRIEPSGSGKSAELDAFEDFLYEQMNRGRRVLLIVDEAQNLPFRTIEELRMLSNMDYEGTPLFQVFLVGQPEFRERLAGPNMEQFRQRVIASYHLEPLNLAETREYVEHRLALVGWTNRPAFSADAFDRIFKATGGVPRKINRLCNRILLHCSIEKLDAVDGDVVSVVFADLKGESLERANAESPKSAPDAVQPVTVADAPPAARSMSAPLPPARKLSEAQAGASRPMAVEDAPTFDREHSQLSALDRLRALRAGTRLIEAVAEHEPATLTDVKRAIEAVTEQGPEMAFPEAPLEELDDDARASASGEVETLRLSVVRSIDETRQELKAAYANVTSLRRRLSELEEHNRARRTRIAEGLTRAESLLSTIRAAAR